MATLQSPVARDFHEQVMSEPVSIQPTDNYVRSDSNKDFAAARPNRDS
jgi:hypothetical protein